MNKLIIAITLVVALAIGWFILNPGDTFDHVVLVDSEITELEQELNELNIKIEAGTLSESDASAAKVQIVTRLNAINEAAAQSEKARLTPAQRIQLTEGLNRLKTILITYQGTLAIVEQTANETAVQVELSKRGSSYRSSKPLNLIVADTIVDVEETVVDSVQDYEADPTLDSQIDLIVAETESEIAAEEAASLEETESAPIVDERAAETVETGTSLDSDEMSSDLEEDEDLGTIDAVIESDVDTVEVSAEAELGTTTN